MNSRVTSSPKDPYEKHSEINFRFGDKSKVQPKGLDHLTPDAEVTVILKGSIKSFSGGDEYDKSKRFSLNMKACEIVMPEGKKAVSLSDALDAAKTTNKKVK